MSTAIVAAPDQHDPITLIDRSATVPFVKRNKAHLDVESISTELGRALVTSIEQTVLDLARKPSLGVAEDQIPEALRALFPRCDLEILDELAARQRLVSAVRRTRRHRAPARPHVLGCAHRQAVARRIGCTDTPDRLARRSHARGPLGVGSRPDMIRGASTRTKPPGHRGDSRPGWWPGAGLFVHLDDRARMKRSRRRRASNIVGSTPRSSAAC